MSARAVFLDMDGTVTPLNTGRVMAETLWKNGHLPIHRMAGIWVLLARYKLGLVRMERIMEGWIEQEAGNPVAPVEELCRDLAKRVVIPTLFEEARAAIIRHQSAGDSVALLSASSLHMIKPIAEALGVEFALGTHVHIQDGVYTGTYDKPVCFGEGKIVWAEQFCESRGLRLEDSVFYTDSITDRPLLERVGEPVAVNPDPRLRRWAKQSGAQVCRWGGV